MITVQGPVVYQCLQSKCFQRLKSKALAIFSRYQVKDKCICKVITVTQLNDSVVQLKQLLHHVQMTVCILISVESYLLFHCSQLTCFQLVLSLCGVGGFSVLPTTVP